jgi:hypothetical protein
MLHADFCMSLAMLMRREAQRDVFLVNSKNFNLPDSRNKIAAAAFEHGSEWLLFLDSDMVFPADTLDRLLAHERPMVGATYCRRVHPFGLIGDPLEDAQGPLRRMARMPTGCLLVHADIFASLERPWFAFGSAPDGTAVSEDFVFCERVRAAGWDIWCDLALSDSLGHIGQVIVTPRTAALLAGTGESRP